MGAHNQPTKEAEANWLLVDPGDGGHIQPATSGVMPLVSAAAETRVLKDPVFIGQQLALFFQTDGGNCVVTGESAINQTGNTHITFADAGEAILLLAVPENAVGSSLRWHAFSPNPVAEGPALS